MAKAKNTDVSKKYEFVNLNNEQLQIYNQIKNELEENRMMIGDIHLLKIYVSLLDIFNTKLRMVQNGYDTQEFNSGVHQVSPDYTIMRNTLHDLMKVSQLIGLPTTTRIKMKLDIGKASSDHELDSI